MGRVNRYELLRETFRNTTGERAFGKGEPEAGEDLYAKFTPRKMKVKSKKKLIIMSVLTGLVLVLLCSTTVRSNARRLRLIGRTGVVARNRRIVPRGDFQETYSRAGKGMMKVKMGASDCHAYRSGGSGVLFTLANTTKRNNFSHSRHYKVARFWGFLGEAMRGEEGKGSYRALLPLDRGPDRRSEDVLHHSLQI